MEQLKTKFEAIIKNGDKNSASEFAVAVRDCNDAIVIGKIMDLVKKELSGKTMENRKAGCAAIVQLCEIDGAKTEAYMVNMLPELLVRFSDKKMAVRPEAKKAVDAVIANANVHSIRQMLPAFFGALTIEKKWQTKQASLDYIRSLATTAPAQIAACLPDIIPEVAHGMWDTRKEVKQSATETMKNICIGNMDIEPFIPALISSIGHPDEVPECVHKLASTTFVKSVDAPTLAIMLPLLIRGLNTNTTAVRRQTAVIIDNMCKLVDDPEEAQLFLPKLQPLLEKVIESAADPELRDVATKAHKTLLRAGGDDDKPYVVELKTVVDTTNSCLKQHKQSTPVDEITSNFVAGMCHDLVLAHNFEPNTWKQCVTPYLAAFMKNGDAVSDALLQLCFTESKKGNKAEDDDDDGAPLLCDCEFSLAYGGMILLNNTRLKLKRGHIYGLCGHNGCGKSTLMRAIANGQLEGFPSKDELKTVFVEHSLQAEEADLNIVEFVMSDAEIALNPQEDVVNTLISVGFTEELRAKAVSSLSGGWKMKLELARAMLRNADILLLDEPTNHLDVKNVAWLENYLRSLTNVTSMVVSHDSGFLDNVCTNIIHYETRKLKIYKGNLSKFVEVYPEAKCYYELQDDGIQFKFPEPGYLDNIKSKGKRILKMENCSYAYPGCDKPTVSGVNLACALSSRVAVLGPNGAGKSTIIKLLTGEAEPQVGEVIKHPNLRFAYVAQHAFHHLEEHLDLTPNQYVQWRFQNGSDKELLAKASRQMTPEEKKQMEKPVSWEGEKRVIEGLRSRRKMKKSFEYEVEWKGLSPEDNEWIPRDRLERWGFEKLLQITDDSEAARANLLARPVTSGVIQKHFEEFGLAPEFSTHSRITGLSGGQKVKVVLGAAMWQNPHMIVLDEPTNYLDRDSLGALASAIKVFGGGVVMISHNNEFTSAICSEVWRVDNGILTIEGETAVDNDTTKIEQKLEEISTDAFGNVVKTKIKRKLTRKERKQREKDKKAALANGDDWSSSDDE